MEPLLDADGIIKLYRAGILALVVKAFPRTIPQAVYDEVVIKGKVTLHQDAEVIEAIVAGVITILLADKHETQESGLGAGELGILSLLLQD